MRLIQTSALEIVDFSERDVPPYAILSHRWDDTELTLQDMQCEDRASLSGYAKVHDCCKQAQRDRWTWVWIDSCCMDKSSSAELSEATNSMFQWYKEAKVCYAYLSDVLVGAPMYRRADGRSWRLDGLREMDAPGASCTA